MSSFDRKGFSGFGIINNKVFKFTTGNNSKWQVTTVSLPSMGSSVSNTLMNSLINLEGIIIGTT